MSSSLGVFGRGVYLCSFWMRSKDMYLTLIKVLMKFIRMSWVSLDVCLWFEHASFSVTLLSNRLGRLDLFFSLLRVKLLHTQTKVDFSEKWIWWIYHKEPYTGWPVMDVPEVKVKPGLLGDILTHLEDHKAEHWGFSHITLVLDPLPIRHEQPTGHHLHNPHQGWTGRKIPASREELSPHH